VLEQSTNRYSNHTRRIKGRESRARSNWENSKVKKVVARKPHRGPSVSCRVTNLEEMKGGTFNLLKNGCAERVKKYNGIQGLLERKKEKNPLRSSKEGGF